ncbi:MAG: glycerophosphodiester phosphodiesterase family protein [Pseudomonadales bacterium]|nr:glycerophosphodiester phosphodiesterase family protein [Pseudomonadales bacterium]
MKTPRVLLLLLLVAAAQVRAEGAVTVIAHRGASGYLPEHTLAAYAYAFAAGADFIEPDLVATRDGVLVARHDVHLETTTDVAERYPERRAEDGHYYAADFVWAELAELRAREPREGRFPREFAVLRIPRLEEVVALVDGLNRATGCRVGLYPELKAPAWHAARGLDTTALLRETLARVPFTGPLRIQSFESAPLRALAAQPIPGATLVRLIAPEDLPELVTDAGVASVAAFADGLGPPLALLEEARRSGDDLVARAHRAGLFVDAWTLRADAPELWPDLDTALSSAVFTLGVDGVFTDHPDRVLAALDRSPGRSVPCSTVSDP